MTLSVKGKRLRLLWSDLHGIERGKYLYGDRAERGSANFCLATLPLTFDREILPIPGLAFDVGLPDVEARHDISSLRIGLEPNTMVGVGDLFRKHQPLPVDPRFVLRRACAPWLEKGLHPQLSFEFEFYLLQHDGIGGWKPLTTPGSRVYGTGAAVDPEHVVDDIVSAAVASSFPIEAWSTEFDDSAFEVNLRYRDALSAADDAFLFRVLAHEIAAAHGYRATFMGRPLAERGGSGLHVNISFRDSAGKNALHDPAASDQLSDLARRCIAGMLAHFEGTAAICAPTVNAYKRLLPDMMNGYWANWGHDDRTVAIRIPVERGPNTRLENRVPDGAANPYLAAATLLHACRFGVEHEMELPEAQPVGEDPEAPVHIPANLSDALDAFEKDLEVCEALGEDLMRAFVMLKRAEWDRYVAAIADPSTLEPTDWELRYYMPFF